MRAMENSALTSKFGEDPAQSGSANTAELAELLGSERLIGLGKRTDDTLRRGRRRRFWGWCLIENGQGKSITVGSQIDRDVIVRRSGPVLD